MDVVRLVDDVCGALDILIKALHGVIDCVEPKPLQGVSKPLSAWLKRVRQPADARRQRRHLCADAQRPSKCRDDPVSFTWLEVREIPTPIVDRLIAIAHSYLVHLPEEVIIYRSELFHRALYFFFVKIRVFLPQIGNDLPPFRSGLSVPLLLPLRPFQEPDVILCFAQKLHRMGLRNQVPFRHIPG